MKKQKLNITAALVFLAAAIYGVVFLHLGSQPIMLWDEGTFAVTAQEMADNGKLMATYFDGSPDFVMNFKPHLNVWMQVLAFKTLGYNELALRLPSALCAMVTVLFLFFYTRKKTGSIISGMAVAMTLLSTFGYIIDHCARTGDTDSMLVMWLTLGAIQFFEYCESLNAKRFWYAILFITLATLTKGMSALLALPALFFWALLRKRLPYMLKDLKTYAGLFLFIGITCLYYFLRDRAVPGFFNAMWNSEVARFWNKDLEGSVHLLPFWYYGKLLLKQYLFPWIFLLLPAYLYLILSPKNRHLASLAHFSMLYALLHFFVISASENKLPWYPAPEYPFTAIITGLAIGSLLTALLRKVKNEYANPALKALIIIGIFTFPYHREVKEIISQKAVAWHAVQYKRYIKKMHEALPGKQLLISDYEANSHLIFYAREYGKQGIPLQRVKPDHKFEAGNVIITCNVETQADLQKKYPAKVLDQEFRCSCMEVTGPEIKTENTQQEVQDQP